MTTTAATRVAMPAAWLWLIRLGCSAIGFGLAFAVRPLADWLISTIDSAPGPLRLAAELPQIWAIVVLTLAGAGLGWWIAEQAKLEALTVTVDGSSVLVEQSGQQRYLAREQIAEVFVDPKEFVVVDAGGRELFRGGATDVSSGALAEAFERYDYPWKGTADPREQAFGRWVDGHPDLDDETHALLRARGRALSDKKATAAAELQEQLQERGVVVRDRDGGQQFRRA